MDIELYDTTLRDGAQQDDISLSVEDKLKITRRLDELGVSYIEGGTPGSNPKDEDYFQQVKSLTLSNARVAAFGLTRRAKADAATDPSIQALMAAGTPAVTLVGKSSDLHVREVLGTTLEENLAMIADSIAYLKSQGRIVFFDAEHFFDGFKANREYAIQSVKAAADAGADCLVLCDTNGGALSSEIADIVACVRSEVQTRLGIHCHNDAELAVANTMTAISAGATHVQGTVNGYGERCGNANLLSIIANLKLKMNISCVTDTQLASLRDVSNYVSEIVNIPPSSNQPYVGASAFSHKGGLHADAVSKLEESYQHIQPAKVGAVNRVVISELSGRGNIQYRLREMGLDGRVSRDQISALLERIKTQESKGFQYEGAEASFALMVRRTLEGYSPPFELVDFMVIVENRRRSPSNGDQEDMLAEAMVKVRVGDRLMHTAAEGNGPVNALDNALRKALLESYPSLDEVKLVDYKVRVVDQGQDTRAVVRVLIESTDGQSRWQTVGSSGNIIEASWMALADSMEYFLARSDRQG